MHLNVSARVRRHAPEGEIVAAGQSATIGYFRDAVVNLDGKVNADALAARGRMWEYLERRGIRSICDLPAFVRSYLGPDFPNWTLVERGTEFEIRRRDR